MDRQDKLKPKYYFYMGNLHKSTNTVLILVQAIAYTDAFPVAAQDNSNVDCEAAIHRINIYDTSLDSITI